MKGDESREMGEDDDIKRFICQNCGGFVVKNYMMSLYYLHKASSMKRCNCKNPDFAAMKSK